jgi:hypothetical protein
MNFRYSKKCLLTLAFAAVVTGSANAGYVANDPMNKTDPTGKDAIVVRQANGDVQIILPVTFSGDAATPANIASFVSNVQGAFTGNFGGTNVTLTVLQGTSAIDDTVSNTVELTSGNTPLSPNGFNNGGHSYVYAGTQAHITTKDINGVGIPSPDGRTISFGTKGVDTQSHEAGHLIGLDDAPTSPGLMGPTRGTAVTGADIQAIQNEGGQSGKVLNTIVNCSNDATQQGCVN